jgi:hypothetical protein
MLQVAYQDQVCSLNIFRNTTWKYTGIVSNFKLSEHLSVEVLVIFFLAFALYTLGFLPTLPAFLLGNFLLLS